MWRSDDRLLIQVWDDGRGGAGLDGGTGMAGLAERLGAVDGLFVMDSPDGRADHGSRPNCRGGTGTADGAPGRGAPQARTARPGASPGR